MARKNRIAPQRLRGGFVHFSLPALAVFTVSIICATGLLAFTVIRLGSDTKPPGFKLPHAAAMNEHGPASTEAPWGELVTHDTQMERPEEYTAMEVSRVDKPKWIFSGMNQEQVRQTMVASGFTEQQIASALEPSRVTLASSGLIVQPDDALVFSLSPEVRSRFYAELGRDGANHYMQFPFCFPGDSLERIVANGGLDPEVVKNLRTLLYKRGDALFLSDFEALMLRIPSQEQRLSVVKALSARSAVLVRVRIRPTTDIDKLLGYWAWAPGVRFTNLRPLLESIKRLDDGSTISLLHFLPQFARERLYTYPLPSRPDDPAMDCHWSTMNFFNNPPDNRFADPAYASSYLTSNYYPVAKPSRYGDRIFLLDDEGNAIHSAVYIADDIVFTKNGNNYMEPWMLMRMKNLLALYSAIHSPRVVVYRSRDS